MTHLVVGGTGTVGSAVVRELLARGEEVRVLTRSVEHAGHLPRGATAVIGDLQDPATYHQAFARADRVFLLNPVVPTELQEGLAGVNEAVRAGATRLVYLSIHDVEVGPHIPHFAAKVTIERAIQVSGLPYTIIRPNNFYQNDAWFRDTILRHGVYPQPIGGVGISRVDVGDIAVASVNALTQPGHEGKSYALVGPEPLIGEACAAAYAKALGRAVRYAGDDLAAWSQQAAQMLPGWMVYDFRLMYAMFQARGLKATPAQLRETETIVGRPPRPFADFVAEIVASWR